MLVGSSKDNNFWANYRYDAAGRMLAFLRVADGHTLRTAFAYNKFGQASHVKITGGTAEVDGINTYDTLGRLTKKQWTRGSDTLFSAYTYKAGANGSTSTQLDTIQFGSGTSTADTGRKYLYDNVGNIVQEQQLVNGSYTGKVWYTYDAASQLVRVDDLVNNQTVQYTYDDQGNITQRTYHAYTRSTPGMATRTDTWTYGGPDGNTLLTSIIDGVTTNYTYPHFGIPSNWTGNRTLTWRNGRTLASIGNTSFTYDGEGQRVSKTTGGVTTEHIYEGDKLVMQKQGNTSLFFLYDTSGLFGFDLIKNGSTTGTYYYRTDGKGEIIALTDSAGNVVANYTYDAWGFPTGITDANSNAITSSTHIGIVNPIRYKGYCYDTETGLYYLNSRYYDPEICRFISADDTSYILYGRLQVKGNLYAYCNNNPVNYADYIGTSPDLVRFLPLGLGWLPFIDGPLPFGDLALGIALPIILLISLASNTSSLPNQGPVSELPEAPEVDAGKQGKHVPGHPNNDKSKSQWNEGESGVKETQEAWQNGKPDNSNGNIRIGTSSDGRTIRVHVDGKGRIHGYPIYKNFLN